MPPRQLRYIEGRKLFSHDMPMHTAANMLLTHISSRGGWAEQRGHHRWPEIIHQVCTLSSSTFLAHRKVTLPDTRNGGACDITVHQFVLDPGCAEDLNSALRLRGAANYASAGGIVRSNQGGFHSDGEALERDEGDAWYRGVHDLVLEALSAIEPKWRDAECFGWLNASGAHDFNCLHDHGDRDGWSSVYYADNGTSSKPAGQPVLRSPSNPFLRCLESSVPCLEALQGGQKATTGVALAGALLLQTRPDPAVLGYSVLPIVPVPGELWFFPAHVTHAVLPRVMPPPGGIPHALGGNLRPSPPDGSLRISVACNIFEAGEVVASVAGAAAAREVGVGADSEEANGIATRRPRAQLQEPGAAHAHRLKQAAQKRPTK